MNLSYVIDSETFAITVFVNDSSEPSLYQPNWPDGTNWASFNEAQLWAEQYISSMLNDTAPYAPLGPNTPAPVRS